jgi:hypothetical protein
MAHLATTALPVEAEGGVGVGAQLLTLAAIAVGVEDETGLVIVLEQHDAHRGNAVRRGGRERHGVGIVQLGVLRVFHPAVEEKHGVVGVFKRDAAAGVWFSHAEDSRRNSLQGGSS